MSNKLLSLIVPYYNHPDFLKFQLHLWNNYSEKIKEEMEIILVDDGSKISIVDLPNLPPFPINLKIYRILEDIPWNEKGARNLGATVSTSNWLLHTDFDHWFDIQNLEKIINLKKEEKYIYRFQRLKYGIPYTQHKETHLIYKEKFFSVGGFDEDFSGIWGGGAYTLYFDILLKQKKMEVFYLNDVYVNGAYLDRFHDCQVTNLSKKTNVGVGDLIRSKKKKYKSGKILRFNWERVL